jgi:parallel beta helix pectate lyase-like protein
MSIKQFLGASLTFAAFGVLAADGHAATYYVAKSGNDSNTCAQAQNISTPRASLGAGVACMSGGDTLYVRGGTYSATANSLIPPSGSSWSNATRIARYANETVVLQPNPFRTFNATMSYVIFDGFVFDMAGQGWRDGISIGQGPHHLRFVNFELKNAGANGIQVNTDGNEFRNCSIHDGGTTDFDNAIYILSSYTVVDGCEISRWAGAAVQIYGGTAMTGNVVSRNFIHDSSGGIRGSSNTDTGGFTNGNRTQGIIVASATDTRVWGNYITNLRANGNPRYAILVNNGAANTKIYNNTISANPTEGIEIFQAGSGTDVKNNILVNNAQSHVLYESSGSTSFTANLCDRSGTGCSMVGNPGFVNASAGDARLTSGSMAINAGVDVSSAGVTVDIDGNARPLNAYDLGAFEFGAGGSVPSAPTNVRISTQ